ncbi:SH3 domain-containing protein [Antarctobacter heliothermus]|nr:SH3 domain-containing protein [Antarctobacter heliothermus]
MIYNDAIPYHAPDIAQPGAMGHVWDIAYATRDDTMLRLLTLLSAIFFASAAAATSFWVDAPRDGYLNLRTGPSVQYQILGKMPHGSQVKLLEAPGKWVKVRHVSGLIGWTHSGFLTDRNPAKGHDRDPGHSRGQDYWIDAPRDGHLNLRNGPGQAYHVIEKMPHGAKARVIYKQDGWYKLTFGGKTGWASSRYLSERKPAAQHDRNPGHSAGQDYWIDAPRDGYLNLRNGPGQAYHVIEKMPHGAKARVIYKQDGWYKLVFDGRTGWASSRYLSDRKPAVHRDRDHDNGQVYWIDSPRNGRLNLRNGPGKGYKVIDKMAHGAKVRVLYKQDGWYKLTFDGKTGWANSHFLSDRKVKGNGKTNNKKGGKTFDSFEDAVAACKGVLGVDRQACLARNISRIK